jgi:predicted permease
VERYKEEVRDERGTRALDDAAQDLRFAWRALRRRPGFSLVAAFTLALGIGATATLYGVVRAVLVAPLPYGGADRVVAVWSAWKGFDQTWLSYDEWEGYRAGCGRSPTSPCSPTARRRSRRRRRGGARAHGAVSANLFRVLQVSPSLGRGFTAEEDRPNGPAVVVLGYDCGSAASAATRRRGRQIQIDGRGVTVVGVMPAGFRLPIDFGAAGPTQAWGPLATDATQNGGTPGPAFNPNGGNHGYYGVARLAPGATVAEADAGMAAVIRRATADGSFQAPPQFRAYAVPIDAQITGRVRPVLLVTFAAVGLILLIACANVAGLLLVRGEQRRRGLAVRIALGVGRPRLVRLLAAESLVLAGAGGLLGAGLAALGAWLVRHTAPAGLARVADTRVDGGVLLFALGAAGLSAVLAGLLPAVQGARVAPAVTLREGGRAATAGAARLRWQGALVVAEVALAVVLVAGAGLMVRSVANLFATETGFRAEGVLTMRLSTPSTAYPDSARVAAFWEELRRRVAAVPGVDAVGAARQLPLASEMGDWGLQVDGYAPPPGEGTPGDWQVVTAGYFEAMGMRPRAGRVFDARDGMDAPLAMVVNRRFAAKYLAGRDPLGAACA